MTIALKEIHISNEKKRDANVRFVSLIKENDPKDYTNLKNIEKEIDLSKRLFRKYNWPTIDVTRKSVEETAASIIKIYNIMYS